MFERFSGRDAEKTNTKTGSFSGAFSRSEPQEDAPAKPEPDQTPKPDTEHSETNAQRAATASARHTDLKVHLHRRLLDMMNLSVIDQMTPEEFRKSVGEMVQELVYEEETPLNQAEQTQLITDILDEVARSGTSSCCSMKFTAWTSVWYRSETGWTCPPQLGVCNG